MKKKLQLFFLFLVGASLYCNAQSMKDLLNRAKEEAKYKATQKVNQKIDQTVDKTMEQAMIKIFGTGGSVFSNNADGQTAPQKKKVSATNGKMNVDGEIIIATNIKCKAGKTTIEEVINGTPGVAAAMVDHETGMLYLSLTGELSSYEEVCTLIKKNGFTADGKKSTGGNNPCK